MLSRIVCQAITGCFRPTQAHKPAWVSVARVSSDASAGGTGEFADEDALLHCAKRSR